MTFRNDDEFTRSLNERVKELEDMTNEINDQTAELEDRATQAEDETTLLDDEATKAEDSAANQAPAPRQEGDTIFFTAKVNTGKPLKLTITNNNGDVDVTGSDSDSVEIEATRIKGEEVDHSHWFFQQVDNEITLRPNWQVGSHVGDLASKLKNQLKEGFKTSEWSTKDFRFGLDVNYDLVVRVPKNLAEGSRVSVKTANGDGQLRDVSAEVDFKTANGDLTVNDVAGALTINSANGDLKATDIAGNVQASTANGDINLGDIAGSIESNTANGDVTVDSSTGAISVRTANGDVNLKATTWLGGRLVTVAGDITVDAVMSKNTSYNLDSVSGDIQVTGTVPAQGAVFTAKSLSGKVTAEGDFEKRGKREWIIGEGNGVRINAKTVSADITVAATVDDSLTLEESDRASDADDAGSTRVNDGNTGSDKTGEINVNLDFELERAKGWIKDLSTKLGTMLGEVESKRADVVDPQPPVAPQPPLAPQAPKSPEETAATADRRAKLLEAVKNGDMTVDEALAELERDA